MNQWDNLGMSKDNTSQKKLLLVDDEVDLRDILKDEFEAEGFLVSEAGNGRLALEQIAKEQFDLVVSDIRMPELSGVELLDALRSKNPELPPVILITGFADISVDEAYDKGAYAVFAKPFNIGEIVATAYRALTPESERFKRKAERIPVTSATPVVAQGNNKSGKVLNIGRGGAFVATQGPLPHPGQVIDFSFEVENQAWKLEGKGCCRWTRDKATAQLPEGYGLEFIEISEDSLNHILEHIKTNAGKAHIPRT